MLSTLWRRYRAASCLRQLMSGMIVVGGLLGAHPSLAASPNSKVYFAGVAYTSNAAIITQAFPHVSTALSGGGDAALNQRVRTLLQSQTLPETIAFDSLGSIKDAANSSALALGLDRETTSVEHIGDVYKLRVEVSAQALFFDFKEKQVLGSFPFIIDFIDVSATPPSDEQIQTAYHNLLFGAPGQHDLASEFAKTLAHASVPSAANKHFRVTSSTLGPKALDYLHQYAPPSGRHPPSPRSGRSVRDLPGHQPTSFGAALPAAIKRWALPWPLASLKGRLTIKDSRSRLRNSSKRSGLQEDCAIPDQRRRPLPLRGLCRRHGSRTTVGQGLFLATRQARRIQNGAHHAELGG